MRRERRFTAREVAAKGSHFVRRLKFLAIICAIALIGTGVYFLFFSGVFSIKNITIVRDGGTMEGVLSTEASAFFQGKNIFFVGTSDVGKWLEGKNEPFKELSLSRKFPDQIEIDMVSHTVVARTSLLLDNYLITEQGQLIPDMGDTSISVPSISLKTVSDKRDDDMALPESGLRFGENLDINLEDLRINAYDIALILKLLKMFHDEFDIEILDTEYFRVAREVTLKTLSGISIIFDLQKPLEQQFHKLRILNTRHPLTRGDIHQVDLRIGDDKIYYQ